jgi:hypothetical protein
MNGLRLGIESDADNVLDVEISLHRSLAFTDEIAFVRLEPVQRETVLVRIDGNGADAEFGRRTKHPDGDLPAIGHQQCLESLHLSEHERFGLANVRQSLYDR